MTPVEDSLLAVARAVGVLDEKPSGLPDWWFSTVSCLMWGTLGVTIIGEWFGLVP